MLINSLKVLAAALTLGVLAGCSTPCGAPGRLCAPVVPNTSAQTAPPRAAGGQPPAAQPAPVPPETAAVTRIALLIPLQSNKLALPAEALRDGFMAAWERDPTGFIVEVMATGDAADEVLQTYAQAVARNDIIVGPLTRAAVAAVAASQYVRKPTIALYRPGRGLALPPSMLAIGLSVEAEARQVADWAASEHPAGKVLVLSGTEPWQQRVAQAFSARWTQLGRSSNMVELATSNGYVDPEGISTLRTEIGNDPPELLFAALDADGLRQVRAALGTAIACYAASPANPGREEGMAVPELDGLVLVDLPWEVQSDHPAVMAYPRRSASGQTLEMDRLYALGIDAFRIAREIALHPDAPVELDGVTGALSARLGRGASSFERREPTAVYRNGNFEPVPGGR